ncbi:MAG: HAD family hydrolase [Clostridia bacterium]|nr:HAD family hydrolase [Clostridia bacterium]
MKEIKAVFFDLDGTLLPMDQGRFMKCYFGELCKVVVPTGYITAEKLVEAIWFGTKAMVKNDGSRPNDRVFWDNFALCTSLDSEKCAEIEGMCDSFYTDTFNLAKAVCGDNPLAIEAVKAARGDGRRRVVLASNPVFPGVGQESRLGWVGLKASDFDFITAYENQKYCKPNPKYYLDICEVIGVLPSECIMIGNDEREDAKAASEAGIDCFLVTDCLIPCEGYSYPGKRGNFTDMLKMLNELE